MHPRIYTYKITFEEVPYWYWGVHKERKHGEVYLGSSKSHPWVWDYYTPVLQILEVFPYTQEGWEEAQTVEKRLIRPDLNNPMCLNENCGGILSLDSCQKGAKITLNALHSEKDDQGRSVHGVNSAKNLMKIHETKNEFGKSVHAVNAGKQTHKERDEFGRSVHGLRSSDRIHAEKDEQGRSVTAVKSMEKVNSQRFRCEVTGHISNSGGLSRYQMKRGIDTSQRVRVQ
jgi:hypothetical protein